MMIMKSAILLLLTSAVLIASERFFLFDVRGDVIATDVLADVDGFPVEYVFQVTAAQRFVIVMPATTQTELANVTFSPATVTPYTVERSDDFYAKFGADKSKAGVGELQGDNLMLVEVEFKMDALNVTEYGALLKRMGDHLQTVHRQYPVHGFHVLGRMPVKIMSFDYQADEVVSGFTDLVGSPFLFTVETSPIYRLR